MKMPLILGRFMVHIFNIPVNTACPFEQDATWNITWPATNSNEIALQKCPGGSEAEGTDVI